MRLAAACIVLATLSLVAGGMLLEASSIGAAAITPEGRFGRLGGILMLLVAGLLLGGARLGVDRRYAVEHEFSALRWAALGVLPSLVLVLTLPAVIGGGVADALAGGPLGATLTGTSGIGLAAGSATLVGASLTGAVSSAVPAAAIIEAWEGQRGDHG